MGGPAGSRQIPTAFGRLLREYRMAKGMRQEHLAQEAGVSPHGISDFHAEGFTAFVTMRQHGIFRVSARRIVQ
jgi:predicted transcriptional regulator